MRNVIWLAGVSQAPEPGLWRVWFYVPWTGALYGLWLTTNDRLN